MKTAFIILNNQNKKQKTNVSFGAGLTAQMMSEIQSADVLEISNRFAKRGIPTDFKGNKVLAWCCDKTIEIFEHLNEKYKLKLALPKGIFVENFENLNVDDPKAISFCNLTPTRLRKDSKEIVLPTTLFFNTLEHKRSNVPPNHQWLYNWDYIDQISDFRSATKQTGTDFFLDTFLHESSHVVHEDWLLKKYGGKTVLKKILSAKDKNQIEEYQRKYGPKLSEICNYATAGPLEAVACDMPIRIVDALDRETLLPIKNPFIDTPYERLSIWQRADIPAYSDEERPLKEILRNIWNGKFD